STTHQPFLPPGVSSLPTTPTTCSKCGAAVPPDALFCMRCGQNFTLEYSTVRASLPGMASAYQGESDTPDQALQKLSAALAGRYEVVRELGKGGMATVYLARDLKHEREVAI